ncbi:MAG: transposase [Chloroflexota bacterium]
MPYNPQIHHRRSIRLKGYDYTQSGAYFITLVTQGRARLFGEIVDNAMRLNRAGRIVEQEWRRLAMRFPNLRLDAFVIMPNHVHGIIVIVDPTGATRCAPAGIVDGGDSAPDGGMIDQGGSPLRADDGGDWLRPHGPPPGSVGAYVGQFKSRVTKRLRLAFPIWQRDYYEHIIRDQDEWDRIRQYIHDNPRHWQEDSEYA